ncbi:MAG: ABC transporter ATP-binding protein [Lentisphaeria bacterium]|nr:ABC transporter ATP-binding protein [Lentisphaeria bacterium]
MALLEVDNLTFHFHLRDGVVRAADGVSFAVERGETFGIVGESGCGKSVTCLSLLGLLPRPPGRLVAGRADFDGIDLLHCTPRQLRRLRGRRIGMVFQDPMTALNPYLRVGTQVREPLAYHLGLPGGEASARVLQALREVGLQDAEERLRCYPHELSGGMRQRVMIAMALIAEPELLIADEPTTALDVTVQAQILDLIATLQRRRGTAVILITHNLGVVAGSCARVAVMYAGRVVELAPVGPLFHHSRHPYTRALRRSLPHRQGRGRDLPTIPGHPPRLDGGGGGCPFAPRCDHAASLCAETPVLREVAPGHWSSCLRVQRGEV